MNISVVLNFGISERSRVFRDYSKLFRYNCIKDHQDRLTDELSHAAQRSLHALSTALLATTTAAHGHPHIHMTGSTRRIRWCAHCNVQKSRARPTSPRLHIGPICACLSRRCELSGQLYAHGRGFPPRP